MIPMKPISRLYRAVLGSVCALAFLSSACNQRIYWLPESNFTLSSDSRLPRWFAIPAGYERKDVTVEIYYYSPPFGKYDFEAVLLGPAPECLQLEHKLGTARWHPESERKGITTHPGYLIASVDGIEEVMEHRKQEPIFYISDDPALTRELKRP
jgi:hypothetical protein